MIINLNEIPEEGRRYICNRNTAEFNEALFDLVENAAYNTEFFIKPILQGFEMTGFIKTETPESCSRCGIDIKMPISTKFHEILMPRNEVPRNSHFSKANHFSDLKTDDGPSVVEFSGESFDMGEYLHEIVALATPYVPAPPEDEKGDCTICGVKVKDRSFSYDENFEDDKKQSPFDVLKNLKLN